MITRGMLKEYLKYIVPTMITFTLGGVYSIIDGVFVGHAVGDAGLAGINVAFPLVAFIMAVGTGVGMGGGVISSIARGAGNEAKARRAMGTTLTMLALSAVPIMALLFTLATPICELLGGQGETLAQAAAPAIRCAREGFGTSYTGELTMEDDSVRRKLDLSPQFRRLYLKPDGSRYRFGEKQVNSELAGLLELVAAEGADAFYTGPVARKMVEQINQRGGCFTLEDLSRYQPKYRTPVKTTYRGLEVAAFAPPSGGCAVVEMLNILEHSDLDTTPPPPSMPSRRP